MDQDLERFRAALRREDRQSLEEYVERLERESLFPKDRSPEYLAKLETRLRLAKDALQEKRRAEERIKGKQRRRRRTIVHKSRDPKISSDDKYDERGRAPRVSEPREKDRGVMKVPPRTEKKPRWR